MANIVVQGRALDEAQLQAIQALVDGNPDWSRRRLADALVQGWDWRNAAGRLKDMSCRRLLARLEAKGLVRLPARRQVSPKRKTKVIAEVPGVDQREWVALLAEVQPVSLEQVGYGTAPAALFDHLLARYHYLGYAYPVGANWLDLGRTTGRTRDDRYSQIQVPTKRVLVLPLQPLARLRRELAG